MAKIFLACALLVATVNAAPVDYKVEYYPGATKGSVTIIAEKNMPIDVVGMRTSWMAHNKGEAIVPIGGRRIHVDLVVKLEKPISLKTLRAVAGIETEEGKEQAEFTQSLQLIDICPVKNRRYECGAGTHVIEEVHLPSILPDSLKGYSWINLELHNEDSEPLARVDFQVRIL